MADRVPVEVGQVRDVAVPGRRRVLVRVVAVDGRWVTITDPDGSCRRRQRREMIEKCPVVAESRPAIVTREHYHALLDQAMDTTKEGESFVPLFVRLCAEAAR